MKKVAWGVALVLWLNLVMVVAAQDALFYDNTGPTPFGSAFKTDHEIADDVRFTGTQTVTAFTILYHADVNVNAIIKFTGVNQTTGRLGATVASFTATNLASGDHVFTMDLSPAQQFAWTAMPGLYGFSTEQGGFFSVRFTTTSGGNPGTSAGWQRASGIGLDGFLDVTANQFISFMGDTAASFYLQLSGAGGVAPAPVLSSLLVNPLSVPAGTPAQGIVTIKNVAPTGGTVVTLESDNPQVASVPASVTIPAGRTNAAFTITTSLGTADPAIGIVATLNGIVRSVVMSVTAPGPALSSVQVTPSSVAGGASAQGLVTLTGAAPAGGTVVALQSSNPQVATAPASVTVPAGATSAPFTVTTSVVAADTPVGITGLLNGDSRSAAIIVTAVAADRVSVTRAEYRASKRELRVEATSTSSSATLQVFVTATNALIGTLQNTGGGRYSCQFIWPMNPQQITVRSNQGGSATRAVTLK
jgi:hypothetical protein